MEIERNRAVHLLEFLPAPTVNGDTFGLCDDGIVVFAFSKESTGRFWSIVGAWCCSEIQQSFLVLGSMHS